MSKTLYRGGLALMRPTLSLCRFSQLTVDQLNKQREEFELLKKELYSLNKSSPDADGEPDLEAPPKTLTDIKNIDYTMQCDRTINNFDNEIRSLYLHEQNFERPRLSVLVNKVYIPKLKAKNLAAYLYAGETQSNHSDYKYVENDLNKIFDDKTRHRDQLILGIESSFDESAASLVNSYGEIIADSQITQWDQWQDNDGVAPEVAKELHEKNIPIVIAKTLEKAGIKKGDPRLKAIAVTLGPGQEKSLNVGLKKAQELGREYGVPVIPVNHIEGHVMTARFSQVNQPREAQVPLLKYPYISLLVTGKHTEIVLTRGVGLHTIMGMTIDCAVGECLDKAYSIFKKYTKVLKDQEAQQEFLERYNKFAAERKVERIPSDYFNFLNQDTKMANGRYIELLAKYGDPKQVELPIGLKSDQNADLSYTGLKTAIQSRFYVSVEDKTIPIYEREMKNLNFEQLLDHAASIQYACFAPCKQKLEIVMNWCAYRKIPLTALNVAGGVSCNHALRDLLRPVAEKHQTPLVYSPPALCTDNASMIGWLGWELINAEQDVDIRDVTVNGIKRIPLGSYVEGLVQHGASGVPNAKKIMTMGRLEERRTKAVNQNKIRRDTGSGEWKKE